MHGGIVGKTEVSSGLTLSKKLFSKENKLTDMCFKGRTRTNSYLFS